MYFLIYLVFVIVDVLVFVLVDELSLYLLMLLFWYLFRYSVMSDRHGPCRSTCLCLCRGTF